MEALAAQRRVWQFLEMLLAMAAGMLVLPPFQNTLWNVPADRADLHLLVMTANMAIGMLAWMLVRRHPWKPVAAMIAAMGIPFVLLAPFYYAAMADGDILMIGGHALMLPCMFLASRLSRGESAGRRWSTRRPRSGSAPRG